MVIIDRRNILELIGQRRDKYHSCILTCYNFDFSFFEERVLPVLQTANIKNVNILADGNYLEQAQEMTTGKEFQYNKSYNFLPVYEKGVFHSKIMLLTGLRHGLLLIGSGNITSSGLSTNDEIWGAFHLDNVENENAPLFSQVWQYLQKFTSNTYGFLPQKIEWITKYSPWLNSLPDAEGEIELTSINQNIRFLSNNNNQAIYQQLLKYVSAENLKTLTIVSPYFDKKGTLLKQLLTDYNPPTFRCIVDTNSGVLPSAMEDAEKKRIQFYDWQNCIEDYFFEVNRLHAKIFHFEYYDGSEKMFLGSANASMAALGGKRSQAVNAEAGILISRNQSGNWLSELKVSLPVTTIDISKYLNISSLDSAVQRKGNYTFRILYSELKGAELNCYLNKEVDEDLSIVINSRPGLILETVIAKSSMQKTVTAKISNVDDVFKIYLTNAEGKRVSNYSITHRLEMLLRCNPDPSQEKFDALLEKEYPNGEGVTTLLEFMDYNWADEDTENDYNNKRTIRGRARNDKDEKEEQTYQILTEAEFNKVNTAILMKQSGMLTSVNVRLADFLNMVLAGDLMKVTDYDESQEQKLLEDQEQKGEGSDVKTNTTIAVNALREKRTLSNYFGKLDSLYTKKLSSFYFAKALSVTPNEPITIKRISKILIALQLIQIYQGKKFITIHDEKDETKYVEEIYLLDGTIMGKPDSVKGFLCNVLGKFLQLATAGFKQYEYSILNDKVTHYRNQVFEKAHVIILNLNWKTEEEVKYKHTLLLNLHFYIMPDNIFEQWITTAHERLEYTITNFSYISEHFKKNLDDYCRIFLPEYQRWHSIYKNSRQSLISESSLIRNGDILFNSKLGFNHVNKIVSRKPYVIDLKKAGYELYENEYLLKNMTYGNKCIKFPILKDKKQEVQGILERLVSLDNEI